MDSQQMPPTIRTSDVYRTKNLPERFDNPDYVVRESRQKCYMPGNPVFSCINPPPSVSLYANHDESEPEDNVQGYSEKIVNPIFRTTNMSYGSKKPNVHTMPTAYHSKSSGFTEHLGKTGMYRNQSLNTTVHKNRVIDY